MSISQYTVQALPSGGASLRAWLHDMGELVGVGAQIDPTVVSDSDALEGVTRLKQLASRLAAVELGLLAQVEARKAARTRRGATSTAAWLRQHGTAAGAANREVTLATALQEHAATREALASGRISAEQAAVITTAVDRLSDAVPDAERVATEALLLDKAGLPGPGQPAQGRGVAGRPDRPAAARGTWPGRRRAMVAQRELTIWADRDGMHHLRGVLDPEGAAHLLNALDPLSAPRPSTAEGQDMRTPARRRADALVDLALIGTRTPEPGTSTGRPTVLVTIDWDTLHGQVTAARHRPAGAGPARAGCTAAPCPNPSRWNGSARSPATPTSSPP